MKQHLARLGNQTLIYGMSAGVLQAVGVITLPVFARAFVEEQFGVLELATVAMSVMLVLSDLGMASASQRSYYDYSTEHEHERRTVLATALLTAMSTAGCFALALILFRQPIADWLFDGEGSTELVVLIALCLPTSILAAFCREVMRLRMQPWHFSTSAILAAVISGGLGIALVVGDHTGIEGVVIGVLAGNLAAVVYGLAVTGRHIGVRLSRREFRIMLAFGLPLLPAAAALWGLTFLDRLMLSRLANLDEVGEYAVGGRFAFVLMFVVTAFGLAYNPFVLSLFSEDRELEKQVRARTFTYLTIVLTGLSVVLALFAREATTVIAPGYDGAYRVVGALCLGVTIFGLSAITMTGISLARRSGYFAVYSLVALVVNVSLNVVLIPPLGGLGAAIATAIAYAALTTLYYRKAQELYFTPYEPRKVLTVLIAGAACMPLAFLPLGAGFTAVKVAGAVAFVIALFATRVIDRVEILELKRLARRFTRRPAANA